MPCKNGELGGRFGVGGTCPQKRGQKSRGGIDQGGGPIQFVRFWTLTLTFLQRAGNFATTFLFPSQLLREPTISEMVFVKTSHFREPKFFPNSSRKNYVRMSFAAFPSFQGIFSRNFTTCHVTDFKSILTFGLLSWKIRIFLRISTVRLCTQMLT